jgi:hypothetical protein
MTAPEDRIPLNYRSRPVHAWPEWLSRDKLGELLIGLGWTACGIAVILTAVCWLFLRMEPRQPIEGAWWAMIAICLAFNTLGLAMILGALTMRFWGDSILATLWLMTFVLAVGVYLAHTYLIVTAPAPPKPVQPLQFQAPEGEGE